MENLNRPCFISKSPNQKQPCENVFAWMCTHCIFCLGVGRRVSTAVSAVWWRLNSIQWIHQTIKTSLKIRTEIRYVFSEPLSCPSRKMKSNLSVSLVFTSSCLVLRNWRLSVKLSTNFESSQRLFCRNLAYIWSTTCTILYQLCNTQCVSLIYFQLLFPYLNIKITVNVLSTVWGCFY